jgi:predicted ATPase
MIDYKFLVTNKFGDFPPETKNTILLIWDNWNDFSYYTLFGINYVNSEGIDCEIGAVRIAHRGQKEGPDEKLLKIGDVFEKLDDIFFSLGTEDSYYETLGGISDEVRDFVLKGLNDVAFDTSLLNEVIDEEVTKYSLLRDISYKTVINQFNRIAHGGARLTNYSFEYLLSNEKENKIKFSVFANEFPPSNIQVIIGSNGVGKSYLLNGMIDSVLNKHNSVGEFIFNTQYENDTFSNLICVTFSAFDEYGFHQKNENPNIKYHYIGLKNNNSKSDNTLNDFADDFTSSIGLIISSQKFGRWKTIIRELESDSLFKSENFIEYIEKSYNANSKEKLEQKFKKLSSGHKIILLTITKLVELLQEKSLIFFDEPETHLHPPLLSSFIRAISKLLINRNAVCIMTSHSPIVLQEVPSSCVYKLSRMGYISKFEKPNLETFGENIGILTNEIFGLEVTESGFYKLLKEIVKVNFTYESALSSINGKLGIEGKSILRSLFFDKQINEKYK